MWSVAKIHLWLRGRSCLWASSMTPRGDSRILTAGSFQRSLVTRDSCVSWEASLHRSVTAAPQGFLHNNKHFQGAVGAALLGSTRENPQATSEQHKGTRQDQRVPGGCSGWARLAPTQVTTSQLHPAARAPSAQPNQGELWAQRAGDGTVAPQAVLSSSFHLIKCYLQKPQRQLRPLRNTASPGSPFPCFSENIWIFAWVMCQQFGFVPGMSASRKLQSAGWGRRTCAVQYPALHNPQELPPANSPACTAWIVLVWYQTGSKEHDG